MPSTSTTFTLSAETLYNHIVKSLAYSLQCDESSLQSKTFTSTFQQRGKTTTVTQKVTTLQPFNEVVFETIVNDDTITASYKIESLDEESCTLTMSEHATSSSWIRRLNYGVLSLPGLNFLSKSRMKARLLSMKQQFER